MKKAVKTIAIFVMLLFFSACDSMYVEPYQVEYVVESTLVADNYLPKVYVFRTFQKEETFDWNEAAIKEAIVEIHLMDNAGDPEKRYTYQWVKKGEYEPEVKDVVKSSRDYEIVVIIPGNDEQRLWGRTKVPGNISIVKPAPDTVLYQSEPTVSVNAIISSDIDRKSTFMNTYHAQKPYYENLTPYYASQAEEDTMSIYYDYSSQAQELVNEANYPRNPDQSLTINFPWKDFAYYGPYSIVIQSLDDNLYDHLRSANAQFGGGNLAPGQIYNAIDHIEGGIGVFGSMATDTVRTFVKRAEE